MVKIDKSQQDWNGTGVFTSRRLRGLDWTWSANSFSSWHLQSLSVAQARLQAQAVNHMISVCEHQELWAAPPFAGGPCCVQVVPPVWSPYPQTPQAAEFGAFGGLGSI